MTVRVSKASRSGILEAKSFLGEPHPRGYPLGLHAFAKVNLRLSVGRLRPDGYHEIDTVLQTIDLADTLYARPRARGFRLEVVRRGPARTAGLKIGAGGSNLVLEAARGAARMFSERRGAEFLLIKRIPAGSGLGGASSDAAATLRLLEKLWDRRLADRDRARLASELGSDCAFFLRGGRARARGRGERLGHRSVPRAQRLLLAIPHRGIPTAHAYRLLDRAREQASRTSYGGGGEIRRNRRASRETKSIAVKSKDLTVPNLVPTILPLRVGRLPLAGKRSSGNDLEEVIRRQYPCVQAARTLLNEQGVVSPRMSGSGSAMFGLLPRRARREKVVTRLRLGSFALIAAKFTRVGSLWCR